MADDKKKKNDEGEKEMEKEAHITYTLEHFKEVDEVVNIVESIGSICDQEILLEAAAERLLVIVDQYQEQPHLLDPHLAWSCCQGNSKTCSYSCSCPTRAQEKWTLTLENIMSRLLEIVRNPSNPSRMVHQAFKYIYYFTKVRGSKYIVRLFSHEVTDIEPLLAMLNQQDLKDYQTWETRYVLLLWLSIACMIPFDMSRLDGTFGTDKGERRQPVVDRIMDIAKVYLCVPDKSRDAAALLLSKFVTRPDVKKQKLAEFIDWCLCAVYKAEGSTMSGMLTLTGVLATLALIFKNGKRDDLIPYAPVVLKQISSCKITVINNTVLRKLNIKLIQRLGLTFLRPRVAAWRYQRGNRSLIVNLEKPQNKEKEIAEKSGQALTPEEEEYDIPEELEEVIEQLLLGLKDKDTVVRWSAAKGVGRVTGRLPKDLADDVVGSVLELFIPSETDAAWHGGCLALAELGRRGLLLPQRLPAVVPVVLKALAYDERRGSYSVGSHVRDGACYVCWSFARAYDPKEIRCHVNQLASALIITALFDREVNCRRAASAAFQENVGRQGTFPHGIDILTAADYHAVGNKTNTYLNLSVFVAQFEEYTKPMIDNLVDSRLQHWDGSIRELASRALHNLTPCAPEYMAYTVLPKVLSMTSSIDLFTRHGSILAAAELVHALCLYGNTKNKSVKDVVSEKCFVELKEIVPKLHSAKLFRGLGGEFMRQAVSYLVLKLSISCVPWQDDPVIELWQNVLDDSLSHTEPLIQDKAVEALSALCGQFYMKSDGNVCTATQEKIIDHYINELHSSSEFARAGFSKALGSLPKFMLLGKLQQVLKSLIAVTKLDDEPGKFSESRRDALNSLASVACTVGTMKTGDENNAVIPTTLDQLFQAFLDAMNDYTTDSRGDVGAWVREASISGLERIILLVVQSDPSLLDEQIMKQVMCCLAQQASEKIDRTRAHAGKIFLNLIHHENPVIPHIPHHDDLLKLFNRDNCSDLNWSAPAECFPQVTQLLSLDTYRYPVLLGLTVSVGGLTESLVRHSAASLLSYLKRITVSEGNLNMFANTIIDIYKQHKKNDRVIIPLFKMLDLLLSNNCFELFIQQESHSFPQTLVTLTKEEITRIGDVRKIITSVNVFCQLLQFPGVTRKKALQHLSILLCHQFPRVRKTTADQLYTTLLMFEDVVPEDTIDNVMAILSDTTWDLDIKEARQERNKLCDLLNIPKPVLKVSAKSKSKPEKQEDDLDSYKDLVSRQDY